MEIPRGFGKRIDKRSRDSIAEREAGVLTYNHTWDRGSLLLGRQLGGEYLLLNRSGSSSRPLV